MTIAIATPRNIDQAIAFLGANSKQFRSVISAVAPVRLPPPKVTHFSYLVRSIVYQQLAGSAARSIHQRLDLLVGEMSPSTMLKFSSEQLRTVGLSQNKYLAIRDLAQRAADGRLRLDEAYLRRLGDDAVVSELVSVRGIGPWTAQMFLMHQLRRLDVWPIGDLGVRHGYGLLYGRAIPTPKELQLEGEVLRPYRSVAAMYCWHAVNLKRQAVAGSLLADRTVKLP